MDTSNFLALVVGFMIANFMLYIIKKSDDDNGGGGDGGMMVPAMATTNQIYSIEYRRRDNGVTGTIQLTPRFLCVILGGFK